jgi:hypothetical protein
LWTEKNRQLPVSVAVDPLAAALDFSMIQPEQPK